MWLGRTTTAVTVRTSYVAYDRIIVSSLVAGKSQSLLPLLRCQGNSGRIGSEKTMLLRYCRYCCCCWWLLLLLVMTMVMFARERKQVSREPPCMGIIQRTYSININSRKGMTHARKRDRTTALTFDFIIFSSFNSMPTPFFELYGRLGGTSSQENRSLVVDMMICSAVGFVDRPQASTQLCS